MKDKVFNVFQNIGRSLMVPIAILPVAGILLAIGTCFQDPNITASMPFLTTPSIAWVLKLMAQSGSVIFGNLSMLFAIGVAIGLTADEGIAGLSAVVGFLIMNVVIGQFLGIDASNVSTSRDFTTFVGIPTLNTGVFGGISMGVLVSYLFKRFHKIELPPAFQFFSGKRFVPLITALAAIVLGLVLAVIWPPVQSVINHASTSMINANLGISAFLFGFIERLAIPFGLNHVWWPAFWLQFGEYVDKAGQVVHGDQLIFFSQLKDGVPLTAGTFMAGETPIKLFAMPAIALAIYKNADEKNKKMVGGIMLSAAITSIVCGVTEPIDFSYLFIAPALYFFNAVLSGLAFLVMYLLKIHIGLSFSGGLIDFIFFGILPNKTAWWLIIPVGVGLFAIYYFLFMFCIKKWNLKTPGRGEDMAVEEESVEAGEKAYAILEAFGGASNIVTVNACMSRLRIDVNDPNEVDSNRIKQLGAAGVAIHGNNFQAVFGMKADSYKEEIRAILQGESSKKINNSPQKVEKVSIPNNFNEVIDKFISPYSGRLVSIEEIPDEVFNSKMMGDGFGIEIDDSKIIAPIDGEIMSIFPTKHAIAIKDQNNNEVLLHIGLNTVNLEGKGFIIYVKQGDKVKKGDLIGAADINLIKQNGYSLVSPVIFTNLDHEKYAVVLQKQGHVAAGSSQLLTLEKNG